jgi:hypothetical protein
MCQSFRLHAAADCDFAACLAGLPGPLAERWQILENHRRGATRGQTRARRRSERQIVSRSFAGWARTHLHLVSGYLEKNPGRPVVPFQPTEIQDAILSGGNVLGLPPGTGLLKGPVGKVLENAGKALTVEVLKKLAESDELRWGTDYRVRDAAIRRYRADYEAAGAAMWKF